MKHSPQKKGMQDAVSALKYLLQPNLLGHYTWFEAVEVVAIRTAPSLDVEEARNVFSIYIAEQGEMPPQPQDKFLSKSKKFGGVLKGWDFLVTKRPVKIEALLECIERYIQDDVWAPPDKSALAVGKLFASPPWFCPPDGGAEVPLNSVLKNNFWSGSYVLEFKDHAKSNWSDLVQQDSLWEKLSAWLATLLPMNLAHVPDRIGDVLLQIPANALVAEFRRRPDAPMDLRVAWNPQVTPRSITVDYRIEQEGMISLQRAPLPVGHLQWEIPSASGDLRFSVYDTENEILLTATAPFSVHATVGSIESYTSTLLEPRRFRAEEPGQQIVTHEVPVWEPSGGWRATRPVRRPGEIDWRARRELKARMNQLIKSKRFLQYGQGKTPSQVEQMRVLIDIRELIRTVSKGAVYLWDPYLSANDILNTLAFCSDAGAELRALTSARPTELQKPKSTCCHDDGAKDVDNSTNRKKWIDAQRHVLDTAFLEPARMKLEYRMSSAQQGGFHDRFLIFPGLGRDRTRVWSLGASINHIGAQHCIVQEVAYPEPVLQAFTVFWEQSLHAKFLIWKYQ